MGPLSQTELVLAWLGAAVALIVVGLARFTEALDRGEAPLPEVPTPGLGGIWAAAAFRMACGAVALRLGYVTIWPDDGVRFLMAKWWLTNFAFGPGDHIWLGGPFIINSLFMRFFEDSATATIWMALFFSAGGVVLGGILLRAVTGNASAAVAGALCAAAIPMGTWNGLGAMTELPMNFCVFACLILAVMALHRREGWRAGALLVASGFFASLVSSFRYEGWIFVLIWNGLAWLGWGIAWWRGVRTVSVWWLLGASFMSGFYPLCWMAENWHAHGDPLYFLKISSSLNREGMSTGIRWRLQLYPHWMILHLRSMSGLAFVALFGGLLFPRRLPGLFLAHLVVLLFILAQIAMATFHGIGVQPDRYSLNCALPAAVLSGTVFFLAIRLWRVGGWWRHGGGGLFGAMALLLAAYVVQTANGLHRYIWYGYRNEAFVAGSLLAQELRNPQLLPGLAKGGRILVWSPEQGTFGDPSRFHQGPASTYHLLLMTVDSERILLSYANEFPAELADEPHLSVIQFTDLENTPPDRFVPAGGVGVWRLYVDRDEAPELP